MSQSGWFRVAEVKAVAKRGVKTFPVYLRLLLSATVPGGLTVSHERESVSVIEEGRGQHALSTMPTLGFMFSDVRSFKLQEGCSRGG